MRFEKQVCDCLFSRLEKLWDEAVKTAPELILELSCSVKTKSGSIIRSQNWKHAPSVGGK